jgi:hypothetical protein
MNDSQDISTENN